MCIRNVPGNFQWSVKPGRRFSGNFHNRVSSLALSLRLNVTALVKGRSWPDKRNKHDRTGRRKCRLSQRYSFLLPRVKSYKHPTGLGFVKSVHVYPRFYSILFFWAIIQQKMVNQCSYFYKIRRFIASFNKFH
jgi:hypothetical protein